MASGLFYSKVDKGWKLEQYRTERDLQEPEIDVVEKNDPFTDISQDTLLVAKQFMVFAHLRCPKPPVRVAKGLLSSTIRCENTSYLGMDSVNVYVGNKEAFYMPFTNEEWHSTKAYPMSRENTLKSRHIDSRTSYEVNKERYGYKGGYRKLLKELVENTGGIGVRKNPNEHWWDKAIQDTVNLCQERGVMMNG